MPVVTRSQKKVVQQQARPQMFSLEQTQPPIPKTMQDKIKDELEQARSQFISLEQTQPSITKIMHEKIKEELDKQKKAKGSEEKIAIANNIYSILLQNLGSFKFRYYNISFLYLKTCELQEDLKFLDKTCISKSTMKRFMELTTRFKKYVESELKPFVLTPLSHPYIHEAKTKIASVAGLRRSNRLIIPVDYTEDEDMYIPENPKNLRRSTRIANRPAVNYAEDEI